MTIPSTYCNDWPLHTYGCQNLLALQLHMEGWQLLLNQKTAPPITRTHPTAYSFLYHHIGLEVVVGR